MSGSKVLALALALSAIIAPSLAGAQSASKRTRRPPAASLPAAQPPAPAESPDAQAWTPPPNEADLALLKGLLHALTPAPREIRIIAVEDLALLGDPRALDALAHLVFDRDPEVARSAVRAVTRFQHPRAEQMLGNIVRHPSLLEPLKLLAVEGLPFQGSPRARELLAEIAASPALSAVIRNAARAILARMAAADPVTTR